MRVILASASPRRAELLTAAGIDFDVQAASVDESARAGEDPIPYALRVARDKAAVVAARAPDRPVLAADTVVVAGPELLGKPADAQDAQRMLRLLSGAVHEVHTAVVLRIHGREATETAKTRVRFVPLSDADIEWYIATGEPDGKAGAYAIQGRASRYVDWIEGSWSNVVGLPIATVYRLLRGEGVIS